MSETPPKPDPVGEEPNPPTLPEPVQAQAGQGEEVPPPPQPESQAAAEAPPQIPKKYRSLLEMCDSPLFTIEMLIHHLKDFYDNEEVAPLLVSKLNRYADNELLWFVPELCNLYVTSPKPCLKRFLTERCAHNLSMYLQVCWCVDAWGTPRLTKKKSKISRESVDEFLNHCENYMVNKVDRNDGQETSMEERMIGKEARVNFKTDTRKFLSNLVNFSLHLKATPKEERKEVANKFLNNINGWIYRRKLNQSKIKSELHSFLYEGLPFPFSTEDNISSSLVKTVKKDCPNHLLGSDSF